MNTLDRYIFRQLTSVTIIVLTALVLLAWFTQIIRLLDIIVEHGRSIGEFLGITLLLLPLIVPLIMPSALFIAILVVLDRMNSDSELAVVGAAGISRWRLARPIFAVGLLAALISFAINVVWQPVAMRDFSQKRYEVSTDFVATLIEEGRFTAPQRGMMMHVKDRAGDGELQGIIFQDSRDTKKPVTYLARRARIVSKDNLNVLILQDGSVIRENFGRPNVELVHFAQYSLDLNELFRVPESTIAKPAEMYLSELLANDPAAMIDPQLRLRRLAEAHTRLSAPLYVMAMIVFALAALGEPQTTRRSRVLAIVVATLVASLVRVGGLALANQSGKSEIFVLPLYALPFVAAGLTMLYMARRRGAGRRRNRDEGRLVSADA